MTVDNQKLRARMAIVDLRVTRYGAYQPHCLRRLPDHGASHLFLYHVLGTLAC